MAELTIRAPTPEDGPGLARLWRLLWDVHEAWGSYPGSRDDAVYADLGARLADEARARGRQESAGRHVHLVASLGDAAVGQVEGWIDRHGVDPSTRWTCEVRSLVVGEEARERGAARALLRRLAEVADALCRGSPAVLAAEVLEANPALAFYTKLGFWYPAYSARIEIPRAEALPPGPLRARLAAADDALALSLLAGQLAERRRALRDDRFDPPRALDAATVDALARYLAIAATRGHDEPAELVLLAGDGSPRGSASVAFATLDPPFLPGVRALMSRLVLDASIDPAVGVAPLLRAGARLARLAGARHLEIVDLPPPTSELHRAVVALGARSWSRVALRDVRPARRHAT